MLKLIKKFKNFLKKIQFKKKRLYKTYTYYLKII